MVEPGLFRIEHVHIKGGTVDSRETGEFTVMRLASGVTFLTSGSYEGTIAPPGALTESSQHARTEAMPSQVYGAIS